MGNPKIAHHMWRSLRSSISPFFQELAISDWAEQSAGAILLAILGKVLLCIGVFGLASSLNVSDNNTGKVYWLGILAAACAATSFSIIASGMYEFGIMCCDRHVTFRQCLIYVSLFSGSAAAGIALSPKNIWLHNVPYIAALIAAITIPLMRSMPDLQDDYRNYQKFTQIQAANWKAGTAPGDSMIYLERPAGRIVGGVVVSEGTYSINDPDIGWWKQGVCLFFGKKTVTFKVEQ